MDNTEVFFKFCEEHWTQARQSEDQRTAITNITLLIASVIIGILSNRGLSIEILPLAVLLIIIGVFGAIASEKLYERHQYHSGRASAYGKRIRDLHPDAALDEYRRLAEQRQKDQFPRLSRIHLHHVWLMLHIAIVLTGIVLTTIIVLPSRA